LQVFAENAQGIGVYFPIAVKLPEFEEFFTAKSKKAKKEGKREIFGTKLLDFFFQIHIIPIEILYFMERRRFL
jgi:hypothetical protein